MYIELLNVELLRLKMSPTYIISCIALYFLFLSLISWYTGKSDSNETFYLGDRSSPWYIVAFGMIGTSLSGVTYNTQDSTGEGITADVQFQFDLYEFEVL